jgi:pullulanase/glycogen debranching enzyme
MNMKNDDALLTEYDFEVLNVVDPNFDWRGEYRRRSAPWDSTIICETHVRAFT